MRIKREDITTLVALTSTAREYADNLALIIETAKDKEQEPDVIDRLTVRQTKAKQAELAGVELVNRAYKNFKLNHKSNKKIKPRARR